MPYFPRTLNPGPDEGDPTYRMSMLPFGTYAGPDGGEHLGFAIPGIISEPVNALARLMGSPSHPGTFTQGPDAGSNAEDMRTLLEAFLGGNATRGMRAVEKGAAEALPAMSTPFDSFFGRDVSPGQAIFSHDPHAPEMFASRFNHNGNIFQANGVLQPDHSAFLDWIGPEGKTPEAAISSGANTLGREGLKAWRDSFLQQYPDITSFFGERHSGARAAAQSPDRLQTIPALFSDQLPSLPGAVIAGAHMPPEIAATVDWPALDGLPKNQGVDRLGSMFSGFYPQFRDSMISAKTGERLPLNDKGPEPLSTYDAAALEQAWRNKIRQTGELYSDGLPSIWSSFLHSQQDQRYPNSLFTY